MNLRKDPIAWYDLNGNTKPNLKPLLESLSSTILKCTFYSLSLNLLVIFVYKLIASPPLHLFYDSLEPAGPGSVYVQGGAFTGFWYQLGMIQAIPSLAMHEYYCYSAGCLSIFVALLQVSFEDAIDAALGAQDAWMRNEISRSGLVEYFVDSVVLRAGNATRGIQQEVMEKINILLTTSDTGVTVRKATDIDDLKFLLSQTCNIPFVTGPSPWKLFSNDGPIVVDGGFSRWLHPRCEYDLAIPVTIDILVHSFNPAFGRDQARSFWLEGQRAKHPLLLN